MKIKRIGMEKLERFAYRIGQLVGIIASMLLLVIAGVTAGFVIFKILELVFMSLSLFI